VRPEFKRLAINVFESPPPQSIIAIAVILEQVTSFNTTFLKAFCPKGLKD
jgi:hypothetical protein